MTVTTTIDGLGAYYTPAILANWIARELCKFLDVTQPISILDPACGDGSLLEAARAVAPENVTLLGRDIDPHALIEARIRLGQQALLETDDSLIPAVAGEQFEKIADAVIANPPWGAKLVHSSDTLSKHGYEIAKGQFDIFDLFIERMMSVCRPECVCAFILPESILLPEHEPIRRKLLEQTQLLLIARLGEGLFRGVNRDTIVLIFRNTPRKENTMVKCFPLSPQLKKQVHSGSISIEEANDQLSHFVPQQRFDNNQWKEFDLNNRVGDSAITKAESTTRFFWEKWVHVGRGVEIGKKGLVFLCSECGWYNPIPRSLEKVICGHCKIQISADSIYPERIISGLGLNHSEAGWFPIMAGEDVHRYLCSSTRFVKLGLPGVNYKDVSEFAGRKLLIRKTGVGLRACVDESGAFTTQTVFHVVLRDNNNPWVLDYLQGMFNSRVMLAIHLRKTGDIQWRSHPYVTPKVFKSLPIPEPTIDTRSLQLAEAIADASREVRINYSLELDLHLDGLVANLLRFDNVDSGWVGRVLNETGEMQYFRELRLPNDFALLPKNPKEEPVAIAQETGILTAT